MDNCFIVFSDDWGEHPSSCQHLFKFIAQDYPTLWVNTVGMRSPKITVADFKKSLHKIRRMLTSGHKSQKQASKNDRELCLTLCQPLMIPFSGIPGCRLINRLSVMYFVKKMLKKLEFAQPITVVTAPNAGDYAGCFGEKRVIYYCVDDFSEWPGLNHDLVNDMERKLIQKTDVFVATAEKLFHKLSQTGKPTKLLTHGVDIEHFSNLSETSHPLLKEIPQPRVGYFGLFDERSDQPLLEEIASKLPRISIVITGNVVTDKTRLDKIPNIYFTGPVPYRELPAIVSGWNVCILPYVRSLLTDSINPLKLKEYIATGKPVITTPLPEVQAMDKWVEIALTAEEWVNAIQKSIESPVVENADNRKKFIADEAWKEKAQLLLDVCLR